MSGWFLLLLLLSGGVLGSEDAVESSFAQRKAAMDPLSRRFLRPNDDVRPLPAIGGVAPIAIEFDNGNGETLRGVVYDRQDTQRLVVLCLGIRGNHTYLLPYARIVFESGCDVLLFDYQGFGRSDGIASALSLLGDTLAAVDYAVANDARTSRDVAIYGLSLGSVLALAAGAERNLAAVITEDLWIPEEMLDRILGKDSSNRLFVLARAALERVVLPALDPFANIARFKGRALLLHGDRDPLLPPGATARVAATRSMGTRVWFMEGAGHAPESLQTHDREYRAQVAAFLDECFASLSPSVARATLVSVATDHAVVRVQTQNTSFVQISVTDDREFRHAWRCPTPGPSASFDVRIDAPFRATRAFVTAIRMGKKGQNGSFEIDVSPLTADLARFRAFERTVSLAALPRAEAVCVEVRPRYALALAAHAIEIRSRDPEAALLVAEALIPFVPLEPEEWVEIASGHFAIGLKDARLALVLDSLAERRRLAGRRDDATFLSDLARRVTPSK